MSATQAPLRQSASEPCSPTLHQVMLPDGRLLAYCEYGDPLGRPTLYCHGFPSSRLEAELFDLAARDAGVRIIAPDRPGYGDSAPDPQRTLLSWAADAQALADHLGLDQLDLLGVSGGGPYALACLACIPNRIARCTLVCPLGPIFLDSVRLQMRLGTRLSFTLTRRVPRLAAVLHRGALPTLIGASPWLIDRVRAGNAGPADRAVLRAPRVASILTRSVQAAMQAGALGSRQDLDLYTRPWGIAFASLEHPIDLWHGDTDNTVPLAHARWYAAHLPHCHLHVLPGEGHYSLPIRHAGRILTGETETAVSARG
ncbi:alpha/beta hydrolase [Thiocapsa imhoffii]|uniref:Alpha/beta hydrolase n=1 Tax=Thiocapsa imhoffii TaxID=382777 RepID=A0A9X0WG62_9GAMM|nr:alpha/beta hydrolase [Thiocapsa imhoffii]MBK1643931.1 alpha/beta hydrolase [Thiocapsa imhoffii]